jgi:ACS family glucarate transporter-like MFS transporter
MKPWADDRPPQDKLASHRAWPGFRGVIVALLFAVSFVLFVDRINITVAAPFLKQEFGFSDANLGEVLGAFMLGYAIGLVPGGWLADRFGPWRVLTGAGLSWAVLTVLMGLTRTEAFGLTLDPRTTLIVARFLLGLCEACAYPTFSRALANWVRRSERASAMGLIQAGSGLGGAVTPVIIAAIISHWGWRESFLLSGMLTLVVALAWWAIAADHPAEHRRVRKEELEIILQDKEESRALPPDLRWYRRLLASRDFYLLCTSQFLFGVAGFVFYSWFFTYFKEQRGAEPRYAAVLSSLTFLSLAIGALAGGLLCDQCMKRWGAPWGRRTVPLLAITFGGLCGLIAPILPNNTASAAVFALTAGVLYLAASGFWSTAIDLTRRGTGILGGLMNAANWLGAALATIAFPRLVPELGWERTLQGAGLAGILSGLVWLAIDSSRQIDIPETTAPDSRDAVPRFRDGTSRL